MMRTKTTLEGQEKFLALCSAYINRTVCLVAYINRTMCVFTAHQDIFGPDLFYGCLAWMPGMDAEGPSALVSYSHFFLDPTLSSSPY